MSAVKTQLRSVEGDFLHHIQAEKNYKKRKKHLFRWWFNTKNIFILPFEMGNEQRKKARQMNRTPHQKQWMKRAHLWRM